MAIKYTSLSETLLFSAIKKYIHTLDSFVILVQAKYSLFVVILDYTLLIVH